MESVSPRSRKIPGRLMIFFLALVGVFFMSFLVIKNYSADKEAPGVTNSHDLEPLEIIEKTEDIKLAESAQITESGQKIIYLTFDDGPGPYTAKLLDVLKKYNVKATFFVTRAGDDALITREYNEGHTVGLHSFTHDYAYIYSSIESFFDDLYSIQARVKNATGITSTLTRFPGGSSNLISARYDGGSHIMSYLADELTRRGFTYFDWNISSGDAGGASSPGEVYENVVNSLKPDFSVVLQHDIKDFSVDAVEDIIKYGQNNGYTFKRLEAGSFTAHHGINN